MEILQLRYFKRLAENGNLTKTAAELFITPPSLSQTIARLERELGATLFDRVGGRMHLNERGQEFLQHVDEGLGKLDLGAGLIKALSVKSETTVSIATTNSTAFNQMISSFLLKYPDASVQYRYFWRGEFENEELLRRYDYVLSQYSDALYENLARQFLAVESTFFAALPASHRLAGRKSIRIEELANERIIMPRQGTGFYPLYMNACRKAGFEPNIVAEGDVLLRVQLLRDGVGITFSAESSAVASLAGNAVMIPVKGLQSQYRQAIMWDKRRMFGRAARLFKDYVLDYYQSSDREDESTRE